MCLEHHTAVSLHNRGSRTSHSGLFTQQVGQNITQRPLYTTRRAEHHTVVSLHNKWSGTSHSGLFTQQVEQSITQGSLYTTRGAEHHARLSGLPCVQSCTTNQQFYFRKLKLVLGFQLVRKEKIYQMKYLNCALQIQNDP